MQSFHIWNEVVMTHLGKSVIFVEHRNFHSPPYFINCRTTMTIHHLVSSYFSVNVTYLKPLSGRHSYLAQQQKSKTKAD